MTSRAEPNSFNRTMRLCVSTALAAGLLAGCTASGPRPSRLVAGADAAMASGRVEKAVSLAEQAVLSDPRNPAYRTLLGNSYLRAGRFESAHQAYDEAMQLGEDSGKAALSLALADIAMGRMGTAIDTLDTYRDSIPASDYGLALAMAGRAAQGVTVLTDALRTGDNTPKLRQNLAYAYALAGQWRQARVMAAQDVPAEQLDGRLQQWLLMARPSDVRTRVATLLGAPVRMDSGQPQALALANFPEAQLQQQAAAQPVAAPSVEAPALAQAAAQELPPVAEPAAPAPAVADASQAPQGVLAAVDNLSSARPAAAPQPYRLAGSYSARAAAPAARVRPAAVAATSVGGGSHLVQLGAFSTSVGAQRAWRHFAAKNPALAAHRSVITQVSVRGHQFWRVQAAGFAGYGAASTMCGTVKAKGGACLVMASPQNAIPGTAVETRFARRR
ncbi:tetratricopeptide repeat protein [Novosphingobium sp. KCTC 2891]|uniref:tetratricopeptide repeat protein n=1 Tax=Novosphingobium sp. KCTC 2891 TaxID=2989730 RepID=UPI002221E1A6|nr:tetratricopeptide repeat protein [Novosphingobium sp. KCTC 2891]MCW1382972.1 tetratricopeptide repeat protein [Novosphingobium sp. KCTC 2891]